MFRLALAAVAAVFVLIPANPVAASSQCVKVDVQKLNVRTSGQVIRRPNNCAGSFSNGDKFLVTELPCIWCKIDGRPLYVKRQFPSTRGRLLTTIVRSNRCGAQLPRLGRCQ